MGKMRIDITGQKFGKLIAIEHLNLDKWKCKCECGNESIVPVGRLMKGRIKSCGCARKDTCWKRIDITGQKLGRLTVLSYLGKDRWLCKCECGTEKALLGSAIRPGGTLSCGCMQRENKIKRCLAMNEAGHNSVSKTEIRLGNKIEEAYGITIERNYLLKDRHFDIRHGNILVESDGQYWHQKPKAVRNDAYKDKLAAENGFLLIRIAAETVQDIEKNWPTKIKPILDIHFQRA